MNKVKLWLIICATGVFLMVLIGGLTRLTCSGLSMVDWQPIHGTIPPLNEQEWQEEFAKYQTSPEFKSRQEMNISDFKSIFILEYVHRLLGRLLGVVFFIPLLIFFLKKKLSLQRAKSLLFIFILGGMQGVLGWYMVSSGLIDNPKVSSFRLASHLLLALVCYLLILREIFLIDTCKWQDCENGVKNSLLVLFILSMIQIIVGAFVVGWNAGLIYKTFPLMNGEFIPSGLFSEKIITIQFIHRMLAFAILFTAIYAFIKFKSKRQAMTIILFCVIVQGALGVITLIVNAIKEPFFILNNAQKEILFKHVILASGHQMMAFIMISVISYFLYKSWCKNPPALT